MLRSVILFLLLQVSQVIGSTYSTVCKYDTDTLLQNTCPLSLSIIPRNAPLKCPPLSPPPYLSSSRSSCLCEHPQFTASVTDCNNNTVQWKNDLEVCIDGLCEIATIRSPNDGSCGERNTNYSQKTFYELQLICFSQADTVDLSVNTLGFIDVGANVTLNVTVECNEPYTINNGECAQKICDADQKYCPFQDINSNDDVCIDNETKQSCASCPLDHGVPINMLNKCVQCSKHPFGPLSFVGIEILPITFTVVLIIITFNIKLTNGFLNGLVLYSQIISAYYEFSQATNISSTLPVPNRYVVILNNVFNLDFMSLFNHPLCITSNMSPLEAVSFWYVIGFYPLLLLLLIYVWIVLYDKGFRCVVCITRPFHRCMARFWSMTGIEPSLTHSIASIYILCYTQIALVSFRILRVKGALFYYDAKQKYFQGHHIIFCTIAILVLLLVIILPTLYIQFYPFKRFHKLLDCLHLRKQLLISLGDVFTGPYKNGSEDNFDHRYIAGFYLLVKFIYGSGFIYDAGLIVSFIQLSFFLTLGVLILIFRPFQKNYHNFGEVLFLFSLSVIIGLFTFGSSNFTGNFLKEIVIYSGNVLIYVILLPVYIFIQICKIASNCYHYHHKSTTVQDTEQGEMNQLIVDDDWIADRMQNPQRYNEQHVTANLDELDVSLEPTATNAATYGSINDQKNNTTFDESTMQLVQD